MNSQFKCDKCPYSSKWGKQALNNLKKHKEANHSEKRFKCLICYQTFSHKYKVSRHFCKNDRMHNPKTLLDVINEKDNNADKVSVEAFSKAVEEHVDVMQDEQGDEEVTNLAHFFAPVSFLLNINLTGLYFSIFYLPFLSPLIDVINESVI